MLTIFAAPKAFEGHIGIIQRNAICSWTLLNPRPEIILLGDEAGISEICAEFGLKHIPDIRRNQYGTPMVSDIFRKAEDAAANQLLCYVNSDIVFINDFMEAVKISTAKFSPCLVLGKHWRLGLKTSINFVKGWDEALAKDVKAGGIQSSPLGTDYFIFKKGLWENIPDFAIGRFVWDLWLAADVKRRKIPIIDASRIIMAIHQNHGYKHDGFAASNPYDNLEFRENAFLWSKTLKKQNKYGIHHFATHAVTKKGIKRYSFSRNYLMDSEFYRKATMQVGRIGIFLNKHCPGVYKLLKMRKDSLSEFLFPKYTGTGL